MHSHLHQRNLSSHRAAVICICAPASFCTLPVSTSVKDRVCHSCGSLRCLALYVGCRRDQVSGVQSCGWQLCGEQEHSAEGACHRHGGAALASHGPAGEEQSAQVLLVSSTSRVLSMLLCPSWPCVNTSLAQNDVAHCASRNSNGLMCWQD